VLTKAETNNAIVVRLTNVRKHPNADRLQLADVLGVTVVVGLDAFEGQKVIYFDSNLTLTPLFLKPNNLYSNKEMNANPEKGGYFGKNGHVRARRLRGEMSVGFVAEPELLVTAGATLESIADLNEGDEFTHIDGVEICRKFIPKPNTPGAPGSWTRRGKRFLLPQTEYFWRHWETHQLMRELRFIPAGAIRLEEKIHGTSGRTAKLLCRTYKCWWQFWRHAFEWKVISGTRRQDDINGHICETRRIVEQQVADKIHEGEQLYYEIYGCEVNGKRIQKLSDYGCQPGVFKVLLYRVTITTPDGKCYDLSRREVDKRADELGWEKPTVLWEGWYGGMVEPELGMAEGPVGTTIEHLLHFCDGKSTLDAGTLREGFVLWFQRLDGSWSCLKHKSAEFLAAENKLAEEGEGDVEDVI